LGFAHWQKRLISFKVAVCEAAELFGFPRSTAAVYVLHNLRDYNEKGQLKKELSALYLQKYAVEEFCSRRSQVIMALTNLKSHAIAEEQIMSVNNFMESNGVDEKKTEWMKYQLFLAEQTMLD
jgi:hypothetical protein